MSYGIYRHEHPVLYRIHNIVGLLFFSLIINKCHSNPKIMKKLFITPNNRKRQTFQLLMKPEIEPKI